MSVALLPPKGRWPWGLATGHSLQLEDVEIPIFIHSPQENLEGPFRSHFLWVLNPLKASESASLLDNALRPLLGSDNLWREQRRPSDFPVWESNKSQHICKVPSGCCLSSAWGVNRAGGETAELCLE